MCFLIPSTVAMPSLKIGGLALGAATCGVAIYFLAGKPPGFLQESIYRMGLDLVGLLPRRLKRLDQ